MAIKGKKDKEKKYIETFLDSINRSVHMMGSHIC